MLVNPKKNEETIENVNLLSTGRANFKPAGCVSWQKNSRKMKKIKCVEEFFKKKKKKKRESKPVTIVATPVVHPRAA